MQYPAWAEHYQGVGGSAKGYYEELLAFIYLLPPEIMRGRLLIYVWKPLQ